MADLTYDQLICVLDHTGVIYVLALEIRRVPWWDGWMIVDPSIESAFLLEGGWIRVEDLIGSRPQRVSFDNPMQAIRIAYRIGSPEAPPELP